MVALNCTWAAALVRVACPVFRPVVVAPQCGGLRRAAQRTARVLGGCDIRFLSADVARCIRTVSCFTSSGVVARWYVPLLVPATSWPEPVGPSRSGAQVGAPGGQAAVATQARVGCSTQKTIPAYTLLLCSHLRCSCCLRTFWLGCSSCAS